MKGKPNKGDLLTLRTDKVFRETWGDNLRIALYEGNISGGIDPHQRIVELKGESVVMFLEESSSSQWYVLDPASGISGWISYHFFKRVR